MVENVSIWLTLEPLLLSKEAKHLAQISRELGKPHPTVRKHLNFFESKGVVTKEKKGRQTLYQLKASNPLIVDYWSVVEKERLLKACKKDLLMQEVVAFLHTLDVDQAVIFGSAVGGTETANDIDVLLVGEPDEAAVEGFEHKFKVSFHIIDVPSLGDVSSELKGEVLKKHLIVEGTEEVVKWMLEN